MSSFNLLENLQQAQDNNGGDVSPSASNPCSSLADAGRSRKIARNPHGKIESKKKKKKIHVVLTVRPNLINGRFVLSGEVKGGSNPPGVTPTTL